MVQGKLRLMAQGEVSADIVCPVGEKTVALDRPSDEPYLLGLDASLGEYQVHPDDKDKSNEHLAPFLGVPDYLQKKACHKTP